MKTTKILASAFIFFVLSGSSLATDVTNNKLNFIESNTSTIASVVTGSGRNKSLQSNVIVEATHVNNIETPHHSNVGRNKKPVELYLSMY